MSAPPHLAALLLALAPFATAPDGTAVAHDEPDFDRDVRPLLNRHCIACHGPDDGNRAADLRLDRSEDVRRPRPHGTPIVPGDPGASLLWQRVTEREDARRMPPRDHGPRLAEGELAVLERWIRAGAPYATHWSLRPRRDPSVPLAAPAGHPIDAFLRREQERRGLEPAGPADRRTLLRRLSLDLVGLPPTPEDVEAFVRDARPDAWERAVDRLLATPAYGERWATPWLDLARYADSAGYGSDPLRTIWRYRDWVIDALNDDLPLDRFTVEQLAGDLLEDATTEQRLATAFHRNTMTNTEGGTDDEEFRVAAVKDRVNTTAQVWLGLTMGCAECHSHKYDPITQREYYAFFAFFNQTADADRNDESPRLATPTREQRDALAALDAQIAALERELAETAPVDDPAERAFETALARGADFAPLAVVASEGRAGTALAADAAAGAIVAADAGSPAADTYVVRGRVHGSRAASLRLEALPDERLPRGGPGRGNGNFVLNDLRVRHAPRGEPVEARIVRVELPGRERILSLAELEVVAGGENVARRGRARQSSTAFGGDATHAIDGVRSGRYEDDSTTHTRTETDPWWEVELEQTLRIDVVRLWNRTDGDLGARLAGCRVVLLDADRAPVWQSYEPDPPAPSLELAPATHAPGVRIARASASFEQTGWDVGRAVDLDRSARSGWAISPRQGEAHEAVFVLDPPIEDAPELEIELHQVYGSGHVLGRFRLSTSASADGLAIPHDVREILAVPREFRTSEQRARVTAFHRATDAAWRPRRDRLAELERARREHQSVTTPVLVELDAEKRRATHVLVKGNFLSPGDPVEADVPDALHPWPEDAPRDRLGLARWIVDPANPLTARVLANRTWARVFGRGLVESEEDFGTQGSFPTHPELLDWLASRLVADGWSHKAFLRQLVTSDAYRRDARFDERGAALDPRNVALARGPRFRLSAEMVRDQALAVSGLLVSAMRGPSVYPPQPEGLWQPAFNGQRTWPTSRGADRHRRALYTFLRRTVPYPSLATFDAPNRELCTVRRTRTNTPLQAFVTWNDPAFLEASQALARRMRREGGDGPEGWLRRGHTLCLQREPSPAALERLAALYRHAHEAYRADPAAAQSMATDPLGPLPRDLDPAETAALTVVANVLLNLDAVLTRG